MVPYLCDDIGHFKVHFKKYRTDFFLSKGRIRNIFFQIRSRPGKKKIISDRIRNYITDIPGTYRAVTLFISRPARLQSVVDPDPELFGLR